MQSIEVNTHSRNELIDITSEVRKAVRSTGVTDGVLVLYVPHTTAGIVIDEVFDPSVAEDISRTLSRLVPAGAGYSHLEGNADSHIKSSIVGVSHTLIIENGELVLGRWQGILFAEFDGPRRRKVYLKVIKE